MFVTPEWEIGDVGENLNSELFRFDPSDTRKKLKKKKKNLKVDKNVTNQNALYSVTKQNSDDFSTDPVEHNIKKSKRNKIKLHTISKLNNLKNTQSKNKSNVSLCDREELLPPPCESKVHIMQNTKQILTSGLKRKHSVSTDSNLLEHKSKKKKGKFSSNEDQTLIQSSSNKDIHNPERKLSRKEKRKLKKKGEQTFTNPINIKSEDVSYKRVTEVDIHSDVPRKRKQKKGLENKLEKSTDNDAQDLLPEHVSKKNVQNDAPKEQKSPYKIQKLKNILEISSNSEQSFKENKGLNKQKKMKNEGTLRERMMRKLKASRFRYLNEQLYTSGGKDSKEYFQSDPEAFHAYHEGYQQQVQQWPINPLDIIIKSLQKKSSELVIADFGCGDARLARSVPNLVHSFDLVAVSKEVTACDMARTPLSNASVDIVVFCLSLMGNNLAAYLAEANRVLKEGGQLKIAEVESRFESVETFIHNLSKFGFVNTWKDLSYNIFYFMDFKKEKCISKKMKTKLPEITLKACLYKKR